MCDKVQILAMKLIEYFRRNRFHISLIHRCIIFFTLDEIVAEGLKAGGLSFCHMS